MNKILLMGFCALITVCCSCNKELIEYKKGDLKIFIEKGESYLHDFPLFMGIKTKNAPQMAIWMEDTNGNYLSTIYVTHKIATCSWKFAGGNRRKEALPHWCHKRNILAEDGLYLPTKDMPVPDGISGATPKSSFDVKVPPQNGLNHFIIKVEVNHSTDFNEFYPKSAPEGAPNYSGGKMGSGQPALVYADTIDLLSGKKEFQAELIGHSMPDGSKGKVTQDVSGITTALNIIKQITIKVE